MKHFLLFVMSPASGGLEWGLNIFLHGGAIMLLSLYNVVFCIDARQII